MIHTHLRNAEDASTLHVSTQEQSESMRQSECRSTRAYTYAGVPPPPPLLEPPLLEVPPEATTTVPLEELVVRRRLDDGE